MAYGLLQHDFVERFLLHWFGMSAHTYTREPLRMRCVCCDASHVLRHGALASTTQRHGLKGVSELMHTGIASLTNRRKP